MSENVCEEKIYKSIFWEYSEMLRNFLYYKTGDMAQAEDLCQDAFAKLWENCAKVTIEKSKFYLFTIANNQFLNQIAHDKVALKFEGISHSDQAIQSSEFLLEEQEFKSRLEQAISNLPEDQRIVFLMNQIDKKNYSEIAVELDLSVKAIEKRMHNALKTLISNHKKL